jgi:hypothetical protein
MVFEVLMKGLPFIVVRDALAETPVSLYSREQLLCQYSTR